MVIEAYSGFTKKPNSTKQPSGSGTQLTVHLKENCSVLNPVFIVAGYSLAHNYIKWGSRYYFIDDIIILSDSHAEYVCSTDVLATYKTDIGSSTQFVLRANSAYNSLVADTKYPAYANTSVENVSFDALHTEFVNGGCFVIGIQNGLSYQSAGVSYYALTDSEMQQLLDFMYGGTWLNAADISLELQKELVNPFQYIDSITWYPYDIPNSQIVPSTPTSIKFGFWDSQIAGCLLNANNASAGFAQQITIPSHPQASRGVYLNGYPYTRLSLDCYSFGTIAIDSSIFAGVSSLTLGLSVDLLTGMGKMTLRAGSDAKIIHKEFAQIGVPMKISQVTQSLVGMGTNVVGGAIGLAYGNVVGVAQGILSGLMCFLPSMTSSGTNGTKSAFVTAPTLIITRQTLVDEDRAQFGRPLCAPTVISTLSGYVECENADLDSAASLPEKNQIMSYMNGGFYYE